MEKCNWQLNLIFKIHFRSTEHLAVCFQGTSARGQGTDRGTGARHGDRGQTGTGDRLGTGRAQQGRMKLGVVCPMTRRNQPWGSSLSSPQFTTRWVFLFCLRKAAKGEGPTHQVPEASRPQLPPGPQNKLPVCPLTRSAHSVSFQPLQIFLESQKLSPRSSHTLTFRNCTKNG